MRDLDALNLTWRRGRRAVRLDVVGRSVELDDGEVVGRGTVNPIEQGYLFWQASFEEADTYYIMVENRGTDDTLYSIHTLGPGVGRTIETAE